VLLQSFYNKQMSEFFLMYEDARRRTLEDALLEFCQALTRRPDLGKWDRRTWNRPHNSPACSRD